MSFETWQGHLQPPIAFVLPIRQHLVTTVCFTRLHLGAFFPFGADVNAVSRMVLQVPLFSLERMR